MNSDPYFESVLSRFQNALIDCKDLYVSSGRLIVQDHPELIEAKDRQFVQLMDDLHKGLLIKLFVEVSESSRQWGNAQRWLMDILIRHIWRRAVPEQSLRETGIHLTQQAASLKWYGLLRPFDRITPLRERIGELETIVLRIANLIAKADGEVTTIEANRLRDIQQEIRNHLHPLAMEGHGQHDERINMGAQAVRALRQDTVELRQRCELEELRDPSPGLEEKTNKEQLADALAQLGALIGLDTVKGEVRTLVNYLAMQRKRKKAGLATTDQSLHMVFKGNPGTGKTTVARIIGKIFGAMGILRRGHLIETDRAGLVAGYAGQTAIKTNEKIDEAMDGVLFIDEAYSLVSDSAEDAFGSEAIQALLKRMEDDRERLIVILAGYPREMDKLLTSNPGLSSRINYHLDFEDYSPAQLGRIFGEFCTKNQYRLPVATLAKVLMGFKWMHGHRDEHFGNGRLVRNTFERAIRNLANRIADEPLQELDILTTFEAADIAFERVPAEVWSEFDPRAHRFAVHCPECSAGGKITGDHLGRNLRCKGCQHRFSQRWAEPL